MHVLDVRPPRLRTRRLLTLACTATLGVAALTPTVAAAGSARTVHAAAGPVVTSFLSIAATALPHAEVAHESSALVASPTPVVRSGPSGSSKATGRTNTSVHTHADGTIVVRTTGSLAATVTCALTSCSGDQETAVVSARSNAAVVVIVAATGSFAYHLDGLITATGKSIAPCAQVDVELAANQGTIDSEVQGPPTAQDDRCAPSRTGEVPKQLAMHGDDILVSTGQIEFTVSAGTDWVDPGTHRTDSLATTWDLTLELEPACTINPPDGYDPAVGAVMTGTSGNDVICGGAGPDTIDGHGGHDRIYGGDGADTLTGNGVIDGGDGADWLCGSAAADRILGGDGKDDIEAGPGADSIDGGSGDDTIRADLATNQVSPICTSTPGGPAAVDHVTGGAGNDVIFGGGGNDVISGGSGDDRIDGEAGRDTLHGDAGADKLRGGSGSDLVVGGSGRDVLIGGGGHDAIHARDGSRDTVQCGGGADVALLDARDSQSGCESAPVK